MHSRALRVTTRSVRLTAVHPTPSLGPEECIDIGPSPPSRPFARAGSFPCRHGSILTELTRVLQRQTRPSNTRTLGPPSVCRALEWADHESLAPARPEFPVHFVLACLRGPPRKPCVCRVSCNAPASSERQSNPTNKETTKRDTVKRGHR